VMGQVDRLAQSRDLGHLVAWEAIRAR
jgi:hypothetical protein